MGCNKTSPNYIGPEGMSVKIIAFLTERAGTLTCATDIESHLDRSASITGTRLKKMVEDRILFFKKGPNGKYYYSLCSNPAPIAEVIIEAPLRTLHRVREIHSLFAQF